MDENFHNSLKYGENTQEIDQRNSKFSKNSREMDGYSGLSESQKPIISEVEKAPIDPISETVHLEMGLSKLKEL